MFNTINMKEVLTGMYLLICLLKTQSTDEETSSDISQSDTFIESINDDVISEACMKRIIPAKRIIIDDFYGVCLPVEFKACKKAKYIGFSSTNIEKFPEWIQELPKLTKLLVSDSSLQSFIPPHKNIEEIYLINNFIKVIPKNIKEFTNLKILEIVENEITALPDEIGALEHVYSMDLSKNRIVSIPSSLGHMKQLAFLNISSNNINQLPGSFINLRHKLHALDLNNNPFFIYGTDGNLGYRELKFLFGNKITVNSEWRVNNFAPKNTLSVYERLKKDKIYWNFDKLKNLKLKEVPESFMSYFELSNAWKELEMWHPNSFDLQKVLSYINSLYVKGTQTEIFDPYIDTIVDALEAIILGIREIYNLEGEKEAIEISGITLTEMAKLIEAPFYEHSGLFCFMYHMFVEQTQYGISTIEESIKNFIATHKELYFEKIMSIKNDGGYSYQNILHWKSSLCEELGLSNKFEATEYVQSKDPYYGMYGNALEGFFNVFTPCFVVAHLTKVLNINKDMRIKMLTFIYQTTPETIEHKKMLLDSDLGKMIVLGISEELVEYALISLGIIVINKN